MGCDTRHPNSKVWFETNVAAMHYIYIIEQNYDIHLSHIISPKKLANLVDMHTFTVTGNSYIFATAASSQVEIGKRLASPKKINLIKRASQSRSISISPSS